MMRCWPESWGETAGVSDEDDAAQHSNQHVPAGQSPCNLGPFPIQRPFQLYFFLFWLWCNTRWVICHLTVCPLLGIAQHLSHYQSLLIAAAARLTSLDLPLDLDHFSRSFHPYFRFFPCQYRFLRWFGTVAILIVLLLYPVPLSRLLVYCVPTPRILPTSLNLEGTATVNRVLDTTI